MDKENSNACIVEKYEGTPFNIVKFEENENTSFAIAITNRVVFQAKTREECEKAIREHDWNLIVSCMGAMSYIMKDFDKFNQEKNLKNEN